MSFISSNCFCMMFATEKHKFEKKTLFTEISHTQKYIQYSKDIFREEKFDLIDSGRFQIDARDRQRLHISSPNTFKPNNSTTSPLAFSAILRAFVAGRPSLHLHCGIHIWDMRPRACTRTYAYYRALSPHANFAPRFKIAYHIEPGFPFASIEFSIVLCSALRYPRMQCMSFYCRYILSSLNRITSLCTIQFLFPCGRYSFIYYIYVIFPLSNLSTFLQRWNIEFRAQVISITIFFCDNITLR